MKVNDALIGWVLLLLSIAVLWHVHDFPNIPGQTYGAALFPTAAAAGLALCSVLLIVSGIRSGQPLLLKTGERLARSGLPLWVTLLTLVGYALVVNELGFFITAFIALIALLLVYGVKPLWAAVVAAVTTAIIHTAFYKLLGVPLPWGILSTYAW
jgi:putative tricarboxylic transport membrane protein